MLALIATLVSAIMKYWLMRLLSSWAGKWRDSNGAPEMPVLPNRSVVPPKRYLSKMPSSVIARMTAASSSSRAWWRETLLKLLRPSGNTFFAQRTIGME